MGSFLKKILEPSEQDAFDHLTWMEKPCIDIFEGLSSEDVLPSPNVGLPSALIPREPPGPAYVTHTGPLVRLLLRQERLGRAAPAAPRTEPGTEPGTEARPRPEPRPELRTEPRRRTEPRPRTEPRSPAERSPGRSTGSGPAGVQERSPGIPKKSPRASPRLCRRVIFARKPPWPALPRGKLECSGQRE